MNNCPTCGNKYKNLGVHWTGKSCDIPSLTDKQLEVITGLLLGDGNIDRDSGNPRLRTNMTNKEYLTYLDSLFGLLSNGVKFRKSAQENAELHKKSGFNNNPDISNYSDIYHWSMSRHPELDDFADWYSSGEKVFPKEINLTPTVLKHWYCCDGCYYTNNSHNYMCISTYNERGNENKIDNIFKSSGLPLPTYTSGTKSFDLIFNVEQTKTLFDYMGKPVKGFEYKWHNE